MVWGTPCCCGPADTAGEADGRGDGAGLKYLQGGL